MKIVYKQYGGKATLSKWIVQYFPEHRVYCEPFFGSGSVLFAKEKSFIEVVNDLDKRIINMFKKIREEPEKLAALLWATPYSKENWRELNKDLDSLEDARLFMAASVQYYCGNGNSSTWAIDKCPAPHKPKGDVWADWFLRVLPAANRLRDAVVLNEDAIGVIRNNSHEDTLIYADPPYYGMQHEYRHQVNYEEMVKAFKESKSKIIVSEYPTAEQFYKDWNRIDKETVSRAKTGRNGVAHTTKMKTEVLFKNF